MKRLRWFDSKERKDHERQRAAGKRVREQLAETMRKIEAALQEADSAGDEADG